MAGDNITQLLLSSPVLALSPPRRSHKIVKCYTKIACIQNVTRLNGTENVNDQCKTGHEGPICNVCNEGYAKSITGKCEFCEDSTIPTEMWLLGCAMLFAGLIFFALVMRRLTAERGAVREELARMRNDKKNWFKRSRTAVKIFTSFYQVTSQFEDTLSVRFPEGEFG